MQPTCATCRFYVAHDRENGECRRYPPSTPRFLEERDDITYMIEADYTRIYIAVENWCGEYQASLTSSPEEVL